MNMLKFRWSMKVINQLHCPTNYDCKTCLHCIFNIALYKETCNLKHRLIFLKLVPTGYVIKRTNYEFRKICEDYEIE